MVDGASMQNELANLEEKRGQKDSFLRAVRRFMEMKTLNPVILKELIEKIEVYHVEGSGKNKTQRIVIHYRFVGCLTIPEWYRKRRVSLESRSGVEVNFLTTAVENKKEQKKLLDTSYFRQKNSECSFLKL